MDFDISEFENPKIRVGKCYQEAAHAVFAHHAGLEVYDVYVTPAGEGNSDISLPADPNPLFIPELATVLLAGEYAESRIWDVHKPESFGDFERQARYDPDCFDFPGRTVFCNSRRAFPIILGAT